MVIHQYFTVTIKEPFILNILTHFFNNVFVYYDIV